MESNRGDRPQRGRDREDGEDEQDEQEECYGPVTMKRYVKDDGRALILYAHHVDTSASREGKSA